MDRKIIITACALGGLSVIIGAYGAHALKELISLEVQQSFEIGVRYQMYHALFLFAVGSTNLVSHQTKAKVYYFVLFGILFFSGSIYGLSTNVLTSFNFKSLGFITPLGGLLLIISWSLVIIDLLKNKVKNGVK